MARPLTTRPQSRPRAVRETCAVEPCGRAAGPVPAAPIAFRHGSRLVAPVRERLAMLRRSARHAATGRKVGVLVGRDTRHRFSRDRMIACYVAHVRDGISLRAIAGATGRHPSTIASVVRCVEGHRDDAGFDRLVADVECVALTGGTGGTRHG